MINLDQTAHEMAIAMQQSEPITDMKLLASLCYQYALAMQAESAKHKENGFPLDTGRPPLKISGG